MLAWLPAVLLALALALVLVTALAQARMTLMPTQMAKLAT
jgi:hypothetical protein